MTTRSRRAVSVEIVRPSRVHSTGGSYAGWAPAGRAPYECRHAVIAGDRQDRAGTDAEGRPATAPRKMRWIPWTLVGALALAIRLAALSRFSYWLDEILEVFVIRSGWRQMFQTLLEQR